MVDKLDQTFSVPLNSTFVLTFYSQQYIFFLPIYNTQNIQINQFIRITLLKLLYIKTVKKIVVEQRLLECDLQDILLSKVLMTMILNLNSYYLPSIHKKIYKMFRI